MAGKEENSVYGMVGHLFRHEAGRMAAVLSRRLGTSYFDDIEDIVQDTLLRAMETWKIKGTPDNPAAWLHTVAWHSAVDYIRKRKRDHKISNDSNVDQAVESIELTDEKEIQDSVLRMMFVCCHSSIPIESQIAFTLKTLGGLSTGEIAKAFLIPEETIAKRIYRAKEKLKEDKIELSSLSVFEIPNRLNAVLKVLYLLFNEGYYSSNPEYVIRENLCEEAMRLTHLLLQNRYTSQPPVRALLALMCFHVSRFNARMDDRNNIILLEYQDRSLWDKKLMAKGFQLLKESTVTDYLSEYLVEASIASVHALAPDFASTNWKELVHLYEVLEELKPGKIIALNKAIAIGYARTPQDGIRALLQIEGLESSQYYHTSLGNFYLKLNDKKAAQQAFEKARDIAQSKAEIELLNQKIESCL